MGWIGIDLDATLALWEAPHDVLVIGAPIDKMVERVRALIAAGQDVRIFTARIEPASPEECLVQLRRLPGYEVSATPCLDWVNYQKTLIENWCQTHLGRPLPITCVKDFHMFEHWDDRAKQVSPNQGHLLEDYCDELCRKIEYLLESQNLYGPEGFTFPDGDHWQRPQDEREGV